ncbi:MAG: YgjV family protein [Crocinitomicaceae bacterium]|nr:YgjV family protein [Crocinitomicaceae bacterium]MCF8409679.1 YgjV family protein [Crocinitomicaceae bacterium]MCF8443951.1 YgjV family protein [Crocinitomicaceae bacterium]
MNNYTEYIGYLASLLVLVSFLMKNMTYLRLVNILGCLVFIAYGALLPSIPIIITNAAIVLINSFYLLKIRKKTSLF